MNSRICFPITNRDRFTPHQGDWIHVAAFGRYSHESGVVQVIDAKAAHSIVNRFNAEAQSQNFPGLLVDRDHFASDPDKPSEAFGWITELDLRDDGIWAHVRWTDTGEQAVRSGRYRMVSPSWMPEDMETITKNEKRPLRMHGVSLTNMPNMRGMVPISNRNNNQNESENHMTEEDAARAIMLEADNIHAINNRLPYEQCWAQAETRLPDAARVIKNANRTRTFLPAHRPITLSNRDGLNYQTAEEANDKGAPGGFDPNFAPGHTGDAGVDKFLKRLAQLKKELGSYAKAWHQIERQELDVWSDFQNGLRLGNH